MLQQAVAVPIAVSRRPAASAAPGPVAVSSRLGRRRHLRTAASVAVLALLATGAAADLGRVGVVASGRTGLTDRLEFQLLAEPFVSLRGGPDADGHGDLQLLLRYRVLDADPARSRPALGLLPLVRVPIADDPIGSERPDFGVVGRAGFDLPWGVSLDLNAGVVAVGQSRPDGFLVQALVGAFVSRAVAERVRGFAETLYVTRGERDGRDSLRLQTGLVWAVARDVALDVALNTSLVGAAPDVEVRGGLSFRLGR
jgi:hypothetical protein